MLRDRVSRILLHPGALLGLALALTIALYAPTLTRGLVNYDDSWLVRDNWIVRDASAGSLHAIWFDLSRDTRAVLGAEYLPVRDLSIMLDVAIWGDAYQGFHLTNLVLYLCSIAIWFAALVAFGIDRRVAALAVLLWAVHPTHAESVAWISERKGLLSTVLAGVAAFGYARFRSGQHFGTRWLALSLVAAVLAVWSKALAVFAIAALPGLELVVPAHRVSWRRSLIGLGSLAIVTALAFVPVFVVATRMLVVDGDATGASGHGWLAMVLGVHGAYVRLGAMCVSNSVSYPISTDGPTSMDIALGAIGLLGAIAVLVLPRRGLWQPSAVIRVAAVIWLAGWFPTSRILLPVRLVVAADRYLLLPTLGLALAVAVGIVAIASSGRRPIAILLGVALVLAGTARTLAAQANWRDATSLWSAAVASNPRDGNAWSMYAEALADAGSLEASGRAIDVGLSHTTSSRLILRRALMFARIGDPGGARVWMQRAADAGEPIAMANLALMLGDAGDGAAALDWARKAVATAPVYMHGHRVHGKLALAAGKSDEALVAFSHAHVLDPSCTNRYNLALALRALSRHDEARTHLLACLADPAVRAVAWVELTRPPR